MGRWRQEVASKWRPPNRTRHVWINRGNELPPIQGFVLEWRRHNYKWSAMVVFVDDTEPPAIVQRWIAAEFLKPVHARMYEMPRKGEIRPPHWS